MRLPLLTVAMPSPSGLTLACRGVGPSVDRSWMRGRIRVPWLMAAISWASGLTRGGGAVDGRGVSVPETNPDGVRSVDSEYTVLYLTHNGKFTVLIQSTQYFI